jgi:superfamily I DNA and/or RNA helicase
MVARIAKGLVRGGLRPGDIGVIAPYAAQIPAIRYSTGQPCGSLAAGCGLAFIGWFL